MKVKIYSSPTCPYCQMAKSFFKSQKIDFEDVDVTKDQQKVEEMVKLSGQMGVPVIVIGDQIIVGFDPEEIKKALASQRKT